VLVLCFTQVEEFTKDFGSKTKGRVKDMRGTKMEMFTLVILSKEEHKVKGRELGLTQMKFTKVSGIRECVMVLALGTKFKSMIQILFLVTTKQKRGSFQRTMLADL
jgi:hypothetical protein